MNKTEKKKKNTANNHQNLKPKIEKLHAAFFCYNCKLVYLKSVLI